MEGQKSNNESCWQAKLDYPVQDPPAAEAKTAPPVASEGEIYFRFMAACAIEQGIATPNGVDVALRALYGRGL